jgi:hypothetical protein
VDGGFIGRCKACALDRQVYADAVATLTYLFFHRSIEDTPILGFGGLVNFVVLLK